MKRSKAWLAAALSGMAILFSGANAGAAVMVAPFNAGDPISTLISALGPLAGISIVPGSELFVGQLGAAGVEAQSGTYSNLNLVPTISGPTIMQADGVLLTTGFAVTPVPNNDSSFDGVLGTPGDAQLSALLSAQMAPSSTTNDANSLSFDFTVAPGITSVELDFVFASDEFPDQSITDAFAVFVDDKNFAFFQDGSLVSFVEGVNANNFNDNPVDSGNYDSQYDGISNSLRLSGILDPTLTTHSIKFVIADTSDSSFDSAVFLANLTGGTNTGGGGVGNMVPEPGSLAIWVGIMGLTSGRRRRRNA